MQIRAVSPRRQATRFLDILYTYSSLHGSLPFFSICVHWKAVLNYETCCISYFRKVLDVAESTRIVDMNVSMFVGKTIKISVFLVVEPLRSGYLPSPRGPRDLNGLYFVLPFFLLLNSSGCFPPS